MRRPLSVLLMLVAGVLTPATSALAAPAHAPAGPAAASLGIRLVDVPRSGAHDPRALRYIIDRSPPGAVIRRRVLVDNNSPSVAHVALYPDAAVITRGSFIGDTGQTGSELTSWIRTSRRALRLAPHASAMADVKIKVPGDASPGERYGVIWAQETTPVRARGNLAVTEVNRVGIRIYLSVGPGGAPPTNFTISRVTGARLKNGDPVVVARVSNTGGRAVDLSGYLKLSDGPGGVRAGPFPIQHGTTLAPGQPGEVWTTLSKQLADGPWRVMLNLVSGLTGRQVYANVDFGGGAHMAYVAALRRYLALAAILVLAAGLAVLVRQRLIRRGRRMETATEDQAST